MLNRKNGETHKQYIQRLKASIDNVRENNRTLRVMLNSQGITNPRTNKAFSSEAEEMFVTLALIEHELRQGDAEIAKMYARGILLQLGFDEVDIETNRLLEDGVYTSG